MRQRSLAINHQTCHPERRPLRLRSGLAPAGAEKPKVPEGTDLNADGPPRRAGSSALRSFAPLRMTASIRVRDAVILSGSQDLVSRPAPPSPGPSLRSGHRALSPLVRGTVSRGLSPQGDPSATGGPAHGYPTPAQTSGRTRILRRRSALPRSAQDDPCGRMGPPFAPSSFGAGDGVA